MYFLDIDVYIYIYEPKNWIFIPRSRENANLEYIKNIVLQYILSESYSVKQQLTTTIATVLQFSPSEVC